MTEVATVFLEWKSADGRDMCLLLVQDKEEDLAWFETVRYSSGDQCWKTVEEVASVDEIEAVNYPEEVINELGD